MAMNRSKGLVAETALRRVDDPFECEVVCRLIDEAKVSDCVADLGTLVKPETADDLVVEPDGDEPLFEFAGLELGGDEYCDVVERAATAHVGFGFLANPPRFLGAVPHADHPDLLA